MAYICSSFRVHQGYSKISQYNPKLFELWPGFLASYQILTLLLKQQYLEHLQWRSSEAQLRKYYPSATSAVTNTNNENDQIGSNLDQTKRFYINFHRAPLITLTVNYVIIRSNIGTEIVRCGYYFLNQHIMHLFRKTQFIIILKYVDPRKHKYISSISTNHLSPCGKKQHRNKVLKSKICIFTWRAAWEMSCIKAFSSSVTPLNG